MTARGDAYRKHLKSALWRNEIRPAVLARDDHHCMICGVDESIDPSVKLQVHHNSYSRCGDERMSDLVTLCTHCHPIADQLQKNRRDCLSQTNQLRVDPSSGLISVETSKNKLTVRKKDDVTKTPSEVDRCISNPVAQRANRRSFESLCKGHEGDQLEARQDGRRF